MCRPRTGTKIDKKTDGLIPSVFTSPNNRPLVERPVLGHLRMNSTKSSLGKDVNNT